MKLVRAHEAMEMGARAMERLMPDDLARPDVRGIYVVAGEIHAATESGGDDRIPVPDWFAEFAPADDQEGDSHGDR